MSENNATVEATQEKVVKTETTTTEAKTEETTPATSPKKGGKKHIIVDPITRIEGHLRIEAIIDENNKIVDAYSSSTLLCLEVWRLL